MAATASRRFGRGDAIAAASARLLDKRVRNIVAPLIFFVVVTWLWQEKYFHEWLGVEEFAVPLPADIVEAVQDNSEKLRERFGESFTAASLGYVIGNALGFVLAVLLLALPVPTAKRIGAICAAIQALPIIAVAPIISYYVADQTWFKAVTVVVLVFPSMLVYTYRGTTSVKPAALELAASYNASGWQVLRNIRLPQAVPYIFTALKYTTILALIGVVVCEILKSHDGLGFEIHNSLQTFGTPLAWGAVGILGLTGILSYSLLIAVERIFFRWSVRHDSN